MRVNGPFLRWVNGYWPAVVILLAACSKQNGSGQPDLNYDEERIASITIKDETRTAVFTYDEQKRLSRIDYNYDDFLSLRFVYNGQTITAQYYKGAAPDPQREKYVFTLLNNRVVNSRMTNPNGSYNDTYFDYDAQNRMTEIGFRSVSSDGSLGAKTDGYYSYSNTGNEQTFKLYGQWIGKQTDTITQTRAWHADKQFVSFSNLGFNYFGTAAAGFAHNIAGMMPVIEPFPFIRSRRAVLEGAQVPYLVPMPAAMQSIQGEGKVLDFSNGFLNPQWIYPGWSWTDSEASQSPYKYDELGRLTSYFNYNFTWK